MSWILTSVVLLFSSVLMSLFLRAGQKNGIGQALANFVMFAVPAALFGIIALGTNLNLLLPAWQLIFTLVTAIVFGYGGYDLFLRSMETSPNTGYPTVISKSYVVFTSIASIFLFHASFNWQSVIGIAAILLFTMVLTHQPSHKKNGNRKWFVYALGTCVLWGGWALVSTQVAHWGINQTVYLFWRDLFVALCALAALIYKGISLAPIMQNRFILILIGASSAALHLSMQFGFHFAPNPGYVNSVNAASSAFVTLFSAFIFKEELKFRKVAAIFGIVIGLSFMFI